MMQTVSEECTSRAILLKAILTNPHFQVLGSAAVNGAPGVEGVAVSPIVYPHQLKEYGQFVRDTYLEWNVQGHLLHYGHMKKLNMSSFFNPEVRPVPAEAKYTVPLWLNCPPSFEFAEISWNFIARKEEGEPVQAMMELYNYSTVSMRLPLFVEVEQHAEMHSKLPGSDA